MTILLTGTVELIKNVKQFDKTHLVEFILSNKNTRDHNYIVRASSGGETDRYGIESLIGKTVEIEAYLNGRKSESAKGTFYTNDIQVRTIKVVEP